MAVDLRSSGRESGTTNAERGTGVARYRSGTSGFDCLIDIKAPIEAMHCNQNDRGMTYGQGGYFSPNVYSLASLPLTYTGYYKSDFHYSINGNVGAQTFQEDSAPSYPLDQPLQLGSGNAYYGK